MTPSPNGISTDLIYDGVVIEKNLKETKHDRAWLEVNIARAKGYLAAKDQAGILSELYELQEHWEEMTR